MKTAYIRHQHTEGYLYKYIIHPTFPAFHWRHDNFHMEFTNPSSLWNREDFFTSSQDCEFTSCPKNGWDTTYSRPLSAITIDTATEIWAAARPATAWHRSNQVMLSLLRPPLSLPTFSDCNSSARLPSAAASVLLSGRLHFWCRLEWISRYNGLKWIGASIAFLQSSLEPWCATMKSNHAVSSAMTQKGKEKRPWPSARRWSLLH